MVPELDGAWWVSPFGPPWHGELHPKRPQLKKKDGGKRSDEVVTLAGMGRERGGTVSWARPGQAKGRKGKGMLVAADGTSRW